MAQYSGKHISQMHLFYELKQQYPNLPDKLVNHCIKLASGDEEACRGILEAEALIPLTMPHRPNALGLEEGSKNEKFQTSHSAPTTPCSITRHAPQIVRRSITPTYFISSDVANSGFELLIQAQLERKLNMERELEKEKTALSKMQMQYEENKALLANRMTSSKVDTLNEEIKVLRMECQRLFSELDSADINLDEEKARGRRTDLLINGTEGLSGGDEDNQHWRCRICTFQNHPLLQQCDKCNMPQITLGTNAN